MSDDWRRRLRAHLAEHERAREDELFDAAGRPRLPERFEPLRVLGRGGAGVVVAAHDRVLGREVAVKALLPDRLLPAQALRLEREAVALGRLRHRHAVGVHELIEERGLQFLVLDLVDGESLAQRIAREGPLDEAAAARLGAAVARALEHAHEVGILHRDVKPGNVLLGTAGPRLGDFGLAKLADAPSLTRTGSCMGTPGFLAPEQAAGRDVGPGVDIYGLGATLYAATTGRPPFEGSEGDVVALLTAIQASPPAPPSALRPELTPSLDAVLLRCLAKDPADRYASAAALAADLDRLAAGEPIGGPSALRGRSGRAAAAALVACALLAAGVWARRPAERPTPPRTDTPLAPRDDRPAPPPTARTVARPAKLTLDHPQVQGARFTPRGRVVTWSRTLVRSWGLEDGAPPREWPQGALPDVTRVIGLPDGDLLVGGNGGSAWLGAATRPGPVSADVTALACDRDGTWAAVGDQDGLVHLISLASRRSVGTLPSTGQAVRALAFAPSGRTLAVATGEAGASGALCLWEVEGRRRTRSWSAVARPTQLVYSADGEHLFLGDLAGTIVQFSVRQEAPLGLFDAPDTALETAHSGRVSGLAVLGGRLVTCSQTEPAMRTLVANTVALWDVATRRRIGVCLTTNQDAYEGVDVSPDGARVLIVESPQSVLVWPTETLLARAQ